MCFKADMKLLGDFYNNQQRVRYFFDISIT